MKSLKNTHEALLSAIVNLQEKKLDAYTERKTKKMTMLDVCEARVRQAEQGVVEASKDFVYCLKNAGISF
jgi:ElaB/YqjD/DUF883 family membrane-anchored ribosome-binding protein